MLAPSQHALYMRARRAAETPNQRALRLRRRRYYAKRRRARIVPTDLRLKWKREWEELVARVQPLWTSTAVAREDITQTPAPVTIATERCVRAVLPPLPTRPSPPPTHARHANLVSERSLKRSRTAVTVPSTKFALPAESTERWRVAQRDVEPLPLTTLAPSKATKRRTISLAPEVVSAPFSLQRAIAALGDPRAIVMPAAHSASAKLTDEREDVRYARRRKRPRETSAYFGRSCSYSSGWPLPIDTAPDLFRDIVESDDSSS